MSQLASRVKRVHKQHEADEPDHHQKIRRHGEEAEDFGKGEKHPRHSVRFHDHDLDFRHAA